MYLQLAIMGRLLITVISKLVPYRGLVISSYQIFVRLIPFFRFLSIHCQIDVSCSALFACLLMLETT